MIQIQHLPASRRKHIRAREGLRMETRGVVLDVLDWSLGGARVAATPPLRGLDGEIPVTLAAEVGEARRSVEIRARVAREEADGGELVLSFDDLPPPGRDLLEALAAGPTEPGRSAPGGAGEGTHDPPRPSPAPALAAPPPTLVPKPSEPKKRWTPPLRAFGYLALGVLLSAYIGDALYRRVWRIEVETAALIAPTARIVSPADGVIDGLEVTEGAVVASGDPLFRVVSPRMEAALEEVEQAVAAAEIQVAELEAGREAWQKRLAIHGDILKTRIGGVGAYVRALEQRLAIADGRVAKLLEVHAQGAVSGTEVDEVRAQRELLAGQLAQARGELSNERRRLGAAREGYYFDGNRVVDGLPEIDATLAAARAMLDVERARLAAERQRADATEIARAPFDGRVAEVLQTEGTPVRHGSLVLVLHQEDDRLVEAWLTRRQAAYVRLGDPAVVEVPGVGHSYDAVVRTLGADPAAVADASGDEPRLRALLELQGYADEPGTADEAAKGLRSVDSVGLPAIVSFQRSWR